MTDFKWIAFFLLAATMTSTLQAETHCPGNNASVPFASRCQTIIGTAPVNHPGLSDTPTGITTIDPELAAASTCIIAELPDAPKPSDFGSSDAAPDYSVVSGVMLPRHSSGRRVLLSHQRLWMSVGFTIDASARMLDAYSTHRALKSPLNHEKFLPDAISHNQLALYGYGASVLFTEFVVCRTMSRHHHERLARWVPLIDASTVFPWDVHNLGLTTRQPLRGLHRIK